MRPKTIDDVILAYEIAVRNRREMEDSLRLAAGVVVRLQTELSAQNKLVSQLRDDVARFTKEAA